MVLDEPLGWLSGASSRHFLNFNGDLRLGSQLVADSEECGAERETMAARLVLIRGCCISPSVLCRWGSLFGLLMTSGSSGWP